MSTDKRMANRLIATLNQDIELIRCGIDESHTYNVAITVKNNRLKTISIDVHAAQDDKPHAAVVINVDGMNSIYYDTDRTYIRFGLYWLNGFTISACNWDNKDVIATSAIAESVIYFSEDTEY